MISRRLMPTISPGPLLVWTSEGCAGIERGAEEVIRQPALPYVI